MEQILWEVIEKSKAGKEFLHSGEQYQNLENVLTQYEKETVQKIAKEWNKKLEILNHRNPEYEKLHANYGGIVDSADDGFYMDFAGWLLAQGKELYEQFKEKGHQAVLAYVEKHNISEHDYLFECMSYAFHPYLD